MSELRINIACVYIWTTYQGHVHVCVILLELY